MSNVQSKTVIVLGMHRSGTSMVAGVLSKLGVNMGQALVGKSWSNPLGHFEDRDFVELNKRILEAAGGSWDAPPSESAIRDQERSFTEEIKAIIGTKEQESDMWGWKDPRTSVTIELYLPYLTNPYFIVCHRDYRAIAESLRRRDGMEIEEGIKLAEIYEERIEGFFRAHPELPRLDIRYEDVLAAPERMLRKIIDFLEIQVSQEQYQEALQLILPREKVRQLSKKERMKERIGMIKKAVTKPWKIPGYVLRKIQSKCS